MLTPSMWKDMWAVFDYLYDSFWDSLDWDDQKEIIQRLIGLCLASKQIDWKSFWKDCDDSIINDTSWNDQKEIIEKNLTTKYLIDKCPHCNS